VARMRSILARGAAVEEPLLTGGVGGRGVLGTDLPLSPWRQVASQGMGDAMGGRARPSRPWAAVCSLRGEGPEGSAQRLGLLRHRRVIQFSERGCESSLK
jgi:hypothetical protein